MKNDDIKSLCYRIIDLIDYVDRISKLHDCNDCMAKNSCHYVPKLGQQTRINCFAWVGDQEDKANENKRS